MLTSELNNQVLGSHSRFFVRGQVLAAVVSKKLKDEGAAALVRRVLRRGVRELGWLLCLPLAALLHLAGVRRLDVRVEHIGHLAEELNTLLKDVKLGQVRRDFWFVLAPPDKVSNQHLLNYWAEHVRVVRQPLLCALLLNITRRRLAVTDLTHYTADYFGTQDIYRVCRMWGERPALLQLTAEDEAWAATQVEQLGVAQGQWFVCLHVREGGFLPHNELIQAHRNADVAATFSAMAEIVRRGGVCIRMGDATMKPLPPMPGVIDYAHHPLKSARLDVVLCAKTRFFLGCTSGLAFVSTAFGVPVAHANMIPMAARGINHRDISIPKLIRRSENGRFLPLQEVFAGSTANFFFSHQYSDAGLEVVENESEDILDLVLDMFDLLDGKGCTSADDAALVERYEAAFRQGHYGYGAVSRVSVRFLRRRRDVLFGVPADGSLAVQDVSAQPL